MQFKEQLKDKWKSIFKDKKNLAILSLSIVVLLLILGVVFYLLFNNTSENKKIDASNFSNTELLQMFYDEGYEVKIYKSGNSTIYVNLENTNEGITLQRIHNSYIGTMMTYDDANINKSMADLIETTENNTLEKEQQLESFQNWIKKYNITKLQISEMLDKYYDENRHNALDLDALVNNLLN